MHCQSIIHEGSHGFSGSTKIFDRCRSVCHRKGAEMDESVGSIRGNKRWKLWSAASILGRDGMYVRGPLRAPKHIGRFAIFSTQAISRWPTAFSNSSIVFPISVCQSREAKCRLRLTWTTIKIDICPSSKELLAAAGRGQNFRDTVRSCGLRKLGCLHNRLRKKGVRGARYHKLVRNVATKTPAFC